MLYFFLCILNCAQCVFNAGDGLPQQPEGAHEAVREEVELWEVGQRGIHCPGKKVEKWIQKTLPYAKINPKGKKWIFENTLAQMRANKEARKREMEEMERMKAQMLEEEGSTFFNWK